MRNKKLMTAATSGLLIITGWAAGLAGYITANAVLMTAATAVAGYPVARSAYTALRLKVLGIEALVTIAAAGAIAIGEYWEAAVVTFLFAFGSYLEARTLDKTRSAIRHLMDMAPEVAVVRRDGAEVEVPVEDVSPGEIVIVRPGGRIPVDGKVVRGGGFVNQSAITGESMPVEKAKGDTVFSGTVNESGYLEIVTEKSGEDTTFARILEMVMEAQETKAPTEQFLNRFARYYTPAIIVMAVAVFAYTREAVTALTLLVIACPGALVIATPVSIVSAIGNAARNGVLIKGGEHLERASKITAVAFDKTGTLTMGKPGVVGYRAFACEPKEMLDLAARAEKPSEHHLARAVVEYVTWAGPEPDEFEVYPGQGIRALVDGFEVIVGSGRIMKNNGVNISESVLDYVTEQEKLGRTVMLVARERQLIGAIAVADVVRPGAAFVIEQLKKLGVKKVVVLSGDNSRAVAALASETGVDEYRAELLPAEKVEAIRELQREGLVVAMVGDGINDAPALAAADVGIAMGAAGTDVAVETADLVLMSDRLPMVAYAVGLSRAAISNIRQNISLAVLVVFALLAGVLGKVVFLASGMLVHEASVLAVILNAMRLLAYRVKP